jgi:phage recombination protein Bet
MSGEITVVKTQSPAEVMPDDQTLISYLDNLGIGKNLSEDQLVQFLNTAKAFQLNPYKREIHPVGYYSKKEGRFILSIITGYEVYIKRAERTGKLNGWEAGVRKEEGDAVGWVKIYRKDWEHPFIHEVYFKEVAQYRKDGALTDFWARSPRFQLKKVAISQGFRLCFPDELGGMPYTSDELPDAMAGREEINVTPASAKQPEPQTDDTIPEAPENFIDDIPGSQEPAPQKPAASHNSDDRQAFLQELRPLMATKRDMIYAFANNNADCLDDEAIQYVHDLDIIAEKHFRKTGQHPIDFMESVQKRLAKAVGESRAQKAREAVPVF